MSNHEYQPCEADKAKNKEFLAERLAYGTTVYIKRHSMQARITHGVVAIGCILLSLTGLFVFVSPLSQLVGASVVFVMRMSHRVLGVLFVAVPLISAITAPKGAWHIVKEDFLSKWDKDDVKWMILFMPYLFMAKHLHMPDQSLNKSGQRFADGMLIILGLVMGASGIALVLGSTVYEMSTATHAIWLLIHDVGFFAIAVFGMAHIFLGTGTFRPYKGTYSLMFGDGCVSESDALYHWGHWARKELEKGDNLIVRQEQAAK